MRGLDICPDDGELDSERVASERHDWPLPLSRSGGRAEPTALDLAEALLSTTHAFKHWGNFCLSHGVPELSNLSIPRAAVLAEVVEAAPGQVRMGDLSSALGVTARNITTIVDALEREGLLVRKPDPTDRRAILLELTEKGYAHVEHMQALQRELAERVFAPLNRREKSALHALLTRLGCHLEHLAASSRSET